jgi:hypothetical protein
MPTIKPFCNPAKNKYFHRPGNIPGKIFYMDPRLLKK